MPTSTRCPDCGAKITLDAGPGEPATCPQCFAEFTVSETAKTVAAAPAANSSPTATGGPVPARRKKKKSGKKKVEDRGPILNAITAIPEK